MYYQSLCYLLGVSEALIGAVEMQEPRAPRWMDIVIVQNTPDVIYSMVCFCYGIPAHAVAAHYPFRDVLQEAAPLLAQIPSPLLHEGVAALYRDDSTKQESEENGLLEFKRPQDFATRGLDKEAPAWHFRRLLYVALKDSNGAPPYLKAQHGYLVNAYTDVPMTDWDALSVFGGCAGMMAATWSGDAPRPFKPTDPLTDDDFWDRRLGARPGEAAEKDAP